MKTTGKKIPEKLREELRESPIPITWRYICLKLIYKRFDGKSKRTPEGDVKRAREVMEQIYGSEWEKGLKFLTYEL